MSRVARLFLLGVAPLLALLLALLGVSTLPTNPLGWFLLLVGATYTVGLIIAAVIRKDRLWKTPASGSIAYEEQRDRSFWFISLGMVAVFYASPVEYIFCPVLLPRQAWLAYSGAGLVILGIALFVWARRTLASGYSGHLSVTTGQLLVQNGPYRLIRHPAYAGYLLMALGISLGYSSLAGLVSLLVLLLPSTIYRMKVEEKLLAQHFGEAYQAYMRKTKRILPGLW